MRQLSRDDLIEIVKDLMNAVGTEDEQDAKVRLFESSTCHPEGSGLIYWPKNPAVTAEEIVDEALSFRPTPLPPPQI